MKTNYFILALLLMGFQNTAAQTEKGRWQLGVSIGSLTYVQPNNGGTKSFSAGLSPSAGYFVATNLLIGTGVPLSLSTSKPTSPNYIFKSTTTGIGLSPFVRYYIGKSRLKPYAGVSYSYTYNRNKYKTFRGDVSGTGYSSIVTPSVGVAYFINRTIALNAGLNYTIQTTKTAYLDTGALSQSRPPIVDLKSDYKLLSLGIGLQVFIGK